MPRPLIIYYYAHKHPSLAEYTYTTNRPATDANDVHNARIIEVKREIPQKESVPLFVLYQNDGNLHYNYFRPYPEVNFKSRARPKRGCGAAFEAKIYEHLLTKFQETTVVTHGAPSPTREGMLIDAGLTKSQSTLKEHFDAFSRLVKANRVKNESKRSE